MSHRRGGGGNGVGGVGVVGVVAGGYGGGGVAGFGETLGQEGRYRRTPSSPAACAKSATIGGGGGRGVGVRSFGAAPSVGTTGEMTFFL